MPKKILLKEASTLSELEKMQQFDAGQRRENLGACKIDKLLRYYHITLNNNYKTAAAQIEGELRKRGLPDYIVPVNELNHPVAGAFTQCLAQAVIDAHGDITVILNEARQAYQYSGVVLRAYVMALVFGEHALAKALETYIKSLNTYSKFVKQYLQTCLNDDLIMNHLSKLADDMEDYKTWE